MKNRLLISIGALFLSSCGYYAGQGDITSNYSSITIPYIKGDEYGEFTAALAREISTSGHLRYDRCDGDLTLCVSVIDNDYDNIGYRYDRKNEKAKDQEKDEKEEGREEEEVEGGGKLSHSVIPVETRVQALAEVTVIETASGCVLLGPARINAFLDFDHEYYYSHNQINSTSLGQLTDYDAAVDGAFKPLYQILAHKIADYIYDAW